MPIVLKVVSLVEMMSNNKTKNILDIFNHHNVKIKQY